VAQRELTMIGAAGPFWDEEKNGALLPDNLTLGSHRQVWWRCEKGHSWQAKMFSVALDGCGCPYCTGVKAIAGETDLVTLNPEIAAQWDTELNGDLDPRTILPSSHEKVWWRCELGHRWQAVPFARTKEKGTGCPYCTGKKVLPGFNDLKKKFPLVAREWYQPFNGNLKPDAVTPGSNKKVWWRCSEGHIWQAAIYSRTRRKGSGCPVCAGMARSHKIPYVMEPPKGKRVKRPAAKQDDGRSVAM